MIFFSKYVLKQICKNTLKQFYKIVTKQICKNTLKQFYKIATKQICKNALKQTKGGWRVPPFILSHHVKNREFLTELTI